MNNYQKNILFKYKPLIRPKEIHTVDLIEYIKNKYTCIDVTNNFKKEPSFKIAFLNCTQYKKLRNITEDDISDIHVIKVLKDYKSEQLFLDSFNDSEIIVYIDSITQYFETDNYELFYLLSIEKSISFKSFENNDTDLINLASLMYIHDTKY